MQTMVTDKQKDIISAAVKRPHIPNDILWQHKTMVLISQDDHKHKNTPRNHRDLTCFRQSRDELNTDT